MPKSAYKADGSVAIQHRTCNQKVFVKYWSSSISGYWTKKEHSTNQRFFI